MNLREICIYVSSNDQTHSHISISDQRHSFEATTDPNIPNLNELSSIGMAVSVDCYRAGHAELKL